MPEEVQFTDARSERAFWGKYLKGKALSAFTRLQHVRRTHYFSQGKCVLCAVDDRMHRHHRLILCEDPESLCILMDTLGPVAHREWFEGARADLKEAVPGIKFPL